MTLAPADAALIDRLRRSLRTPDSETEILRTDFDLNPQFRPADAATAVLKPAAVLIPIVRRPHGLTVVFTRRTDDMPTHAGQVAFPGGRVQAEDASLLATAMREAQEEVGLDHALVEPFAAAPAYQTVTGYRVHPFLALVDDAFVPKPDPREVADVFEPPLSFVLDPANLERRERIWNGAPRSYFAIAWGGFTIWGATAGMIQSLHDALAQIEA